MTTTHRTATEATDSLQIEIWRLPGGVGVLNFAWFVFAGPERGGVGSNGLPHAWDAVASGSTTTRWGDRRQARRGDRRRDWEKPKPKGRIVERVNR